MESFKDDDRVSFALENKIPLFMTTKNKSNLVNSIKNINSNIKQEIKELFKRNGIPETEFKKNEPLLFYICFQDFNFRDVSNEEVIKLSEYDTDLISDIDAAEKLYIRGKKDYEHEMDELLELSKKEKKKNNVNIDITPFKIEKITGQLKYDSNLDLFSIFDNIKLDNEYPVCFIKTSGKSFIKYYEMFNIKDNTDKFQTLFADAENDTLSLFYITKSIVQFTIYISDKKLIIDVSDIIENYNFRDLNKVLGFSDNFIKSSDLQRNFQAGDYTIKLNDYHFNSYLFHNIVMNNRNINNMMYIDESDKIFKKKGGIMFYTIIEEKKEIKTSNSSSIEQFKTVISTSMTLRIDKKEYLNLHIRKIHPDHIKKYFDRVQRLFNVYFTGINEEKKKLYQVFGKDETEKYLAQNDEDVRRILQKKEDAKTKKLTEKAHLDTANKCGLLPENQLSLCGRAAGTNESKYISVISKEEYDNHIKKGRDANVLLYKTKTTDEPCYLSCLENEKYTTIGLSYNKNHKIIFPCCFEKLKNPNKKIRELYDFMLKGEKYTSLTEIQKQKFVLTKNEEVKSRGMLDDGQFSYIRQDILTELYNLLIYCDPDIVLIDGEIKNYKRIGVEQYPDSILYALNKATDKELTKQDIIDILKNNDQLVSFETRNELIKDTFLNGIFMLSLLEFAYDCNIIIVRSDFKKKDEQGRDVPMEVYSNGKQSGDYVILFENEGSSRGVGFHQYEIISKTEKQDMLIFKEDSDLIKNLIKLSSKDIPKLDKKITSMIKGYSLDEYGFARYLYFDNVTVLIDPILPIKIGRNITREDKYTDPKHIDEFEKKMRGLIEISRDGESMLRVKFIGMENFTGYILVKQRQSFIDAYNNNKKMANILVSYIEYFYDKLKSSIDINMDSKKMASFITIDKDYDYGNLKDLYTKSLSNKMFVNGKMIVKSETIKRKLLNHIEIKLRLENNVITLDSILRIYVEYFQKVKKIADMKQYITIIENYDYGNLKDLYVISFKNKIFQDGKIVVTSPAKRDKLLGYLDNNSSDVVSGFYDNPSDFYSNNQIVLFVNEGNISFQDSTVYDTTMNITFRTEPFFTYIENSLWMVQFASSLSSAITITEMWKNKKINIGFKNVPNNMSSNYNLWTSYDNKFYLIDDQSSDLNILIKFENGLKKYASLLKMD